MQFDRDVAGAHAELFLSVRAAIMERLGAEVHEKLSENITSYFLDNEGYCYLRTQEGGVRIGWFRGVTIEDRFGLLHGKGKILRGQLITHWDAPTQKAVAYYIDATAQALVERAIEKEMLKIVHKKGHR